jgi:hypothetical protein
MTLTCEKCGATENVVRYYGREHIDKSDEWLACWECRKPYWEARIHPEPEPEPEPSGQTAFGDFC